MTNNSLKKLVSFAPSSPGIYMFKEGSGTIYIGKAANLKARLSSYLKTTDPRILKMLSVADDIEFHATDSDIEALILESQLIKNLQPRFNIMLRDDKQYFYVGFSNENFSKVFITHQPTKVSSIKYQVSRGQKSHTTKYIIHNTDFIGPFTDGAVLKSTLKFLRRIFPYCTCKNPHNNFCLNYHIGKCLGFCCLKNPVSSIRYQVSREYRKNIKAIKGVLTGRKTSVIKGLEKEMQRSAKEEKFEKAIELRKKLKNLKRIFENARIIHNTKYLIRNTESGTKSQNALKELARLLKISRVPNRIEGYDISNIQGTNATGSMVVFEDGVPNKSRYRKFKIRSKRTPDDTLMLGEMLQRRFNHPEWKFPDLILIDGGQGQLNTAKEIVKLLGRKINIISLAKGKYEIFSTTLKKPVGMASLPPNVRNLIKNIDAEAHRFAISYYRKLHRRNLKAAL